MQFDKAAKLSTVFDLTNRFVIKGKVSAMQIVRADQIKTKLGSFNRYVSNGLTLNESSLIFIRYQEYFLFHFQMILMQ